MKFLLVNLTKESADVKAGVSLASQGGTMLVISKITEGGLFETTAKGAKVGMRVLRINGVAVDGMSSEDAVAIIKGAEGQVPFLLLDSSDPTAVQAKDINAATVHKTTDGKVKISFSGAPGAVQLTKIADGSPFENTALKIGDTLLAVNNIALTGMDVDQIKDILGQATDPVTLIFGTIATAPAAAAGDGPAGLPAGGTWGTIKYVGPQTKQTACIACLCCGLPGCCVLLCPSDQMDVYKVNNKLYKADGTPCTEGASSFVPTKPSMSR